jgi:hypothetical protein
MRKTALTVDLLAEFYDRREKEIASLYGVRPDEIETRRNGLMVIGKHKLTPEAFQALMNEVHDHSEQLWRQYRHRIPIELEKIEAQYQNQLQATHTLTMVLSRLSCLSCYIYTIADLAGTGIHEPRNYMDNAKRYQDQISQLLYNNIIIAGNRSYWEKGFNPSHVPTFPDMQYARPNLKTIISRRLWDVLLLVFYSVLFYSLAFFRLLKYDVR